MTSKVGGNSSSLKWMYQVKNRLKHHIQSNTTDLMSSSNQVQTIDPFQTYLNNPQRDLVATRMPYLIGPSCILPSGHVMATSTTPTTSGNKTMPPILVHRDKHQELRAYINQCRHRGARLVKSGDSVPLKSSTVTCPYHAWTYDITTGQLKGIPGGKVGFPCLHNNLMNKSKDGDEETLSLRKLHCYEHAGNIWVQDDYDDDSSNKCKSNPSLTSSWPTIESELSDILLPPPTSTTSTSTNNLIGYKEWYIHANWQLLVETFLESYHVKFLHSDTLGIVAHSNIMVTDILDKYSLRMTVPLKNFNIHDNDGGDDTSSSSTMPSTTTTEDDIQSFLSCTTTTYLIFPNTAVSIFKRFALILSIIPITSNDGGSSTSASSFVRAWGIPHRYFGATSSSDETNEEVQRQQQQRQEQRFRDFESVIKGIEEDWDCAQDIQYGLQQLSLQQRPDDKFEFQYGRYEGNNVNFLKHVEEISKTICNDCT